MAIRKKKVISCVERMKPAQEEFNRRLEMITFFLLIWHEREHKSEVSGTYLGKEALTTYFHHILPKSKYPEARLDEENIILLTADEHASVEQDAFKYEEVNKRRNQLKIKYGIL